MVYKRYIKREGKVFGPYYYESHRDKEGKTHSIYVSPEKIKQKKRAVTAQKSFFQSNKNLLLIFLLGISLFVFVLIYYQAVNKPAQFSPEGESGGEASGGGEDTEAAGGSSTPADSGGESGGAGGGGDSGGAAGSESGQEGNAGGGTSGEAAEGTESSETAGGSESVVVGEKSAEAGEGTSGNSQTSEMGGGGESGNTEEGGTGEGNSVAGGIEGTTEEPAGGGEHSGGEGGIFSPENESMGDNQTAENTTLLNETIGNVTGQNETIGNQTGTNQTLNETKGNGSGVLNETIQIPNETLVNETCQNITIINETTGNVTIIFNETCLNVAINQTLENVTETNETGIINKSLKQENAKIGEPVKWRQTISYSEFSVGEKIDVEIPQSAEIVSVKQEILEEAEILQSPLYKKRFDIKRFITDRRNFVIAKSRTQDNFISWLLKLFQNKLLFSPEIEPEYKKIPVEATGNAGEIELEYTTPAPIAIEEETVYGKKVEIIGPDNIHYEDVLAFTDLPRETSLGKVKVYWVEEDEYLVVTKTEDKNNNGFIDYIEWIVPHLSNQTFEIIIEISGAEHLDENRTFLRNIYAEVAQLDGNWSEAINSGEYVRVSFEKNLTKDNDVTVYPRIRSGNPRIEVYEFNRSEKIAGLLELQSEEYNKVYLTGLSEGKEQDTFDLKVVGGSIEIDHIVDPTIGTLSVNFVEPTPSDGTIIPYGSSVTINTSISDSLALSEVKFNWNGTNYTIYNDSLVLMYNFDNVLALEESNVRVVDLSKYGNNGTVYGGAAWNPNGKYRGAYQFDGIDDYLDLGNPGSLRLTGAMTLDSWVFINSFTGNPRIISKSSYGSRGWELNLEDDGTAAFQIASASSAQINVGTTSALQTGQWVHLTGVYEPGVAVRIYVNGVLNASTTSGVPSTQYNSANNVYIGKMVNEYFNGKIDEVRVWNRALSAAEIQQQYFSNSYKYAPDKWALYVNQSRSSTAPLDAGSYIYQAFASDVLGNSVGSEQRSIVIGVPLSNCGVLSTPNTVYALQNDIANIAGTCFTITADNVTLDGNAHAIAGIGGASGYGVLSNQKLNLIIKDLNISNFNIGIYLINVNNSNLVSNIANENVNRGIFLEKSFNNSLSKNIVNKNSIRGIYLFLSSDNNIINNSIASNPDAGIALQLSYRNIISNNNIKNGSNGILITAQSGNNFLINNIINGSSNIGLYLFNSSNNLLINNLLINNKAGGLKLEESHNNTISNNSLYSSGIGFYLSAATGNRFGNNYIFNSSNSIQITSGGNGGSDNVFFQDKIVNSNNNAFHFVLIPFGGNNTLINLTILGTNPNYLDLSLAASSRDSKILFEDMVHIGKYNLVDKGAKLYFKNSQYGKVDFYNLTVENGENLTNDVKIRNNSVYVNSSKTGLNKSALITLYNLPTNFVNPKILRDGKPCSSDICYNLTSLNAGNVTFNVTSWSNYSIGEYIVLPNITLLILNSTDVTKNDTNQNLTLYVNATSEGNIHYFGEWYKDDNAFVGQYWNKTAGGSGNDYARGIAIDNLGNVYVTGSYINAAGNADFLTIKYYPNGIQIWSKTYDLGSNEEAYSIATDNNGNVYVTGRKDNGLNSDILSVKYDSNGNLQWNKTEEITGNDSARGIAVDNEGNVYVTGTSVGNEDDFYTFKYDGDGNLISSKRLDLTGNQDSYAIAVDNEGNLYVTGRTLSGDKGTSDILTVKYNASWSVVWNKTEGGTNYDEADGIAVDNEGNVYVAGSVYRDNFDFYTVKYDNEGNKKWEKYLGGLNNEIGNVVVLDSENVYLAGYSDTGQSANSYLVAVKYNKTGALIWNTTFKYSDSSYEQAYGIALDSGGNIYAVGATNINGNYDFLTLKYKDGFSKLNQQPGNLILADVLDSIFIEAGDIWKACIYAENIWGGATNRTCSNDILINSANVAPNDPIVFINSTDGSNRTKQDLHCFATISDPEADRMNVSVKWYKNGLQQLEISYNNSYLNGSLSDVKLDNENTTKGENWSCSIRLFDGELYSDWVNSINLTILNTPPVVTLGWPRNNDAIIERKPTFNWTGQDDDEDVLTYLLYLTLIPGNGAVCTDPARIIDNIINPNYTLQTPLKCFSDNGHGYAWSIRVYDGRDYRLSPNSNNFFLQSQIIINAVNNIVDFGTIDVDTPNKTTENAGGPEPFVLQNDGNAIVNVSVNASDLWQSVKNPSDYYKFKVRNASSNISFDFLRSITSHMPVPNSTTANVTALAYFNYEDENDTAFVDVYIKVPGAEEGSGARSSVLTFIARLAEGFS